MDKVPLQLRSHGFCGAELYNSAKRAQESSAATLTLSLNDLMASSFTTANSIAAIVGTCLLTPLAIVPMFIRERRKRSLTRLIRRHTYSSPGAANPAHREPGTAGRMEGVRHSDGDRLGARP